MASVADAVKFKDHADYVARSPPIEARKYIPIIVPVYLKRT